MDGRRLGLAVRALARRRRRFWQKVGLRRSSGVTYISTVFVDPRDSALIVRRTRREHLYNTLKVCLDNLASGHVGWF